MSPEAPGGSTVASCPKFSPSAKSLNEEGTFKIYRFWGERRRRGAHQGRWRRRGGVGLSYCARQQQQQAGKARLAIAKLALLQFTSIGVAFLLRGLLEAKGNEPKRDQEPNELKNQAQEKPRTEDQERERKLLRIGG